MTLTALGPPLCSEVFWFILDGCVLGEEGNDPSPIAVIFSTFQKALNTSVITVMGGCLSLVHTVVGHTRENLHI